NKLLYLFFVSLVSLIHANDIAISMHISKTQAYQGEPLVLDVNISQVDHSKVMLFQFSPKKSDKYQFHQVDFREDNRYHNLKHTYRYLIYPTNSGKIQVGFDMVKSITDDSKIAYSISGDRDNVKGLVKKDITVNVAPLTLDIKALPSGVKFIGDYRLEYSIDKNSVDAYEPINIAITIKGSGLPLQTFDIIPKSKKYDLFKQKPILKTYYLQDSSQSSIEWSYALSAKENFTLDAITLKAFNPKTQKLYTLSIPKTIFAIKAIKKEELVDKVDYPKEAQSLEWGWLLLILSYIAVFIAGFLTPRDLMERFKKEVVTQSEFENEIDQIKSKKELLSLVLAQNSTHFDEVIEELNREIYQKEKKSLKEIKTLLKDTIDTQN
ncbi:MAG: hypothetical protein U9N49_12985, partial [Campylobacterota bacterium]|nr:hypothetical protein [Campylobacterota bacterium]